MKLDQLQPFGEVAPAAYKLGLPVIPLVRGNKNPVGELTGWQKYSETLPDPETQLRWQTIYARNNVGLVLGPQSGLCVIDIDTDDPIASRVFQTYLPPSPWQRRGQKGCALLYKYGGHKNFKILRQVPGNEKSAVLVELLSQRLQIVLPPSIHPVTQRPYEANENLCNEFLLSQVHPLPTDIEAILRAALEEAGILLSISGFTRVTDWVSRGARDVTMVGVAGHYSHGILRGELTFKQAVERMVAWHSTSVEHVAGDDIDIEKGVRKLAEFLIRDVTGAKKRPLPPGWDDGLTPEEYRGFGFETLTDEHRQFSYQELQAFILNEFSVHARDAPERRQAVTILLERIARSPSLDRIDRDRLLRYVADAGQLGVGLPALRATLTEMEQGGVAGNDHSEIADAVIEDLRARGDVAYSGGSFWIWEGSHWGRIDEMDLMRQIANNYGHLPLAKRQGDHRGILKVMAAKVARDLKQSAEAGVNFANGFLTQDLVLREHHPDFGATYTLPFRYLSPGKDDSHFRRAGQFFDFLFSCWGHEPDYQAKVDALQEAICVTLFGIAPRYERVFCLHGAAKSGKSQLLRIVMSLVPPEATCAVPPNQWGDKFLPAQLFGKLLNVCGELSERRDIDGQNFKQIVSGETITGQHKNQQPFVFRPMCAHWFATNHLPKTDDTSSGFVRRWQIFTYTRVVAEEDKIIGLGTRIAAEEREHIAAWAVEAITRLEERNEYTQPDSHKVMLEEVANLNNTLRAFLTESGQVLFGRFAASTGSPIPETTLYNAYFAFALQAGVAKPASLRIFRSRMKELGYELGFQINALRGPSGLLTYEYGGITLASAGGKTGSSLKLISTSS